MKKHTTSEAAILATQAQLAARYAVTVRTIQLWAQTGKLRSIHVGTRGVRYNIAEADRAVLGAAN